MTNDELRTAIIKAIDSQEPGALSTPGLAYTAEEVLDLFHEYTNEYIESNLRLRRALLMIANIYVTAAEKRAANIASK